MFGMPVRRVLDTFKYYLAFELYCMRACVELSVILCLVDCTS